MPTNPTILITGVAGYWGRLVAGRLLQEPEVRVIGVDAVPPERELPGLTFIRADIRGRDLPALLASHGVQTVCHLAFSAGARHSAAAFDFNVMGAINVYGAAAKAGVRNLIAMSSTAIYGARPGNPTYLKETAPAHGDRDVPEIRYLVELEQFYEQLRETAPGIRLAILRFAHIVGPTVESAMARYLRDPWTPVLLGSDPLLQVIHEGDVVKALTKAILDDIDGPVNVAARPPLPLSRVLGMVRKLPLAMPYPLASWGEGLLAEWGRELPLPLSILRHRLVVDTARMEHEWGFSPTLSAAAALRTLASAHEQPVVTMLKSVLARRPPRRSR